MRFLVDECTGPGVGRWLREQGYEIFSVYEEVREIDDDAIIKKAYAENWVLITNDKDFGEKVYREKHRHRGIILLRLENDRVANKIKALQRVLDNGSILLV
jgi:predicted nuclease of predicted toxin-antitoxin system